MAPREYEGVVAVEHVDTRARVFVRATEDTTMGDLRERLGEVLGLPKGSVVRLVQEVAGGYMPFSDRAALGGLRSLKCGGTVWRGTPELDAAASLEFLEELLSIAEASPPPATLAGLERMLPDYGLEPCVAELQGPRLEARPSRGQRGTPLEDPRGEQRIPGESGASRASEHPALLRRAQARAAEGPVCEAELSQHGPAVTLCSGRCWSSITFYTSAGRPCDLFAVALSSPPCAKRAAAEEWAGLKERLLPVLESTAFLLFREALAALPRRLCGEAAPAQAQSGDGGERGLSMPWGRLGREAYGRADFFLAASLYSQELEELQLAGGHEGEESVALSNRAACLAKVGHHEAALEDARRARDLRPAWGRAWSRIGASAAALGQRAGGVQSAALLQEACQACFRAAELEPSAGSIEALEAMVARTAGADSEAAHEEKETGNRALRANELGLAVAHYTRAIASTPAPRGATDDYSMLRAVLRSNRAGALCRLRCWALALADARQAVACRGDWAKAHARLGTALLGSGETEEAYAAFARSLVLDPGGDAALRGRQACLAVLPAWRSVRAQRRVRERFGRDLCRPSGSSRVYFFSSSISDVHFDHKCNEEWAHSIDDFRFQEDVLIVAGNVCDSRNALVKGLTTLRAKFRRVFYVPGNHETWIHPSETTRYPDSLAKLLAIMETCDELDVDVFPAAIAHDVFIVPLLSWYSAEFDYEDPYPSLDGVDKYSKWPLDPDTQLWKYMLKMNEAHFGHPYHGTVITFSHFLPRRDLPFKSHGDAAKSTGCTQLDDQIRRFSARKRIHVYGHSPQSFHALKDDIWYVNLYHGQEAGHSDRSPIFLIHDGEDTANRCVYVTTSDVRQPPPPPPPPPHPSQPPPPRPPLSPLLLPLLLLLLLLLIVFSLLLLFLLLLLPLPLQILMDAFESLPLSIFSATFDIPLSLRRPSLLFVPRSSSSTSSSSSSFSFSSFLVLFLLLLYPVPPPPPSSPSTRRRAWERAQ
ncbi:unnamed protein product [Prorocentrum cordatum]|uniref:Calcineurin-like phosphoesterase domain-containing protein n=1 Tax=Prorocentrum cordatum TaxID=2364126 RepID=A0ABN9TAJ5_9DINO|nr:unnamed protein product [Polarella glacialis]